jgi:hypothetical protein
VVVAPTRVRFCDVAAGHGGFAIEGIDLADLPVWSASGAGDDTGAGLTDLVVGTANAARAYVVFATAYTATVALADVVGGRGGLVLEGVVAGDGAGRAVARGGDDTGDGLDDVLVSASNADVPFADSGRVYVVFGKADSTPVLLADVAAGTGGFALDGSCSAIADGHSSIVVPLGSIVIAAASRSASRSFGPRLGTANHRRTTSGAVA